LRAGFLILGLMVGVAWPGLAAAQSTGGAPPSQQGVACPPDVPPPTVGGANPPTLSERLADSKGVICPPAGVDPDIRVPPPGGGELRIIPAPGTPGGNPDRQPK
jgi:hypothetical protein